MADDLEAATRSFQAMAVDEPDDTKKELAELTQKMCIFTMLSYKDPKRPVIGRNFYLMDVNWYCKFEGSQYMIAESSLIKFSLKDGIKLVYHELIVPHSIPPGYDEDIQLACNEYCLHMPTDKKLQKTDYKTVLYNIIDIMRMDEESEVLPPIYAMPNKVGPITNFIKQLCDAAGEDSFIWRIYRLDLLFSNLVYIVGTASYFGFPEHNQSLARLEEDEFKFAIDLECAHHTQSRIPSPCSASRAHRLAFTVLATCCRAAQVKPLVGRHVPRQITPTSYRVPSWCTTMEELVKEKLAAWRTRNEIPSPSTSTFETTAPPETSGSSPPSRGSGQRGRGRGRRRARGPRRRGGFVTIASEGTAAAHPGRSTGQRERGRGITKMMDRMKIE